MIEHGGIAGQFWAVRVEGVCVEFYNSYYEYTKLVLALGLKFADAISQYISECLFYIWLMFI